MKTIVIEICQSKLTNGLIYRVIAASNIFSTKNKQYTTINIGSSRTKPTHFHHSGFKVFKTAAWPEVGCSHLSQV